MVSTVSDSAGIDVEAIARTWRDFEAVTQLRPVRSVADYERMVELMNGLVDVVGDDESHPLAGLLDLVGELVMDFDVQHHLIPASEPHRVLGYLMQEHGLKQTDLADLVAQPNVSAILNGRREISRALAKGLAKRFNVAVDIFL